MATLFFFWLKKSLLEKWKPLADKKSQTTSQRDRTSSIKRRQIRAKLRRAYSLVYKNSGVEITSSSTDMTSDTLLDIDLKKNLCLMQFHHAVKVHRNSWGLSIPLASSARCKEVVSKGMCLEFYFPQKP